MLFGALCESCRRPLGSGATNLQLVTGEIVMAGSMPSLRGTRPPESYTLCSECAQQVYTLVHALTRGKPASSRP